MFSIYLKLNSSSSLYVSFLSWVNMNSTGVQCNSDGPLYHWYQYKMVVSFQSFYWWICISLRGLRLFSHAVWLGTGQFQWSIDTTGTIGTNRKPCHSNDSVGEYASHWGDLDYFLMLSNWVQDNSDGPLVPMVRLVPIEKHVIPMVLLVNMHLIKGT